MTVTADLTLLLPALGVTKKDSCLTAEAADHPQSSGEASKLVFTVDVLLLTRHCPPVGLKWYFLHRGRPVIQTEEPAGCRASAASPCHGKNTPEDFTSNDLGMCFHLNMLKFLVFHTFLSLLISWYACLKGPVDQNSNFLLSSSPKMTNAGFFLPDFVF